MQDLFAGHLGLERLSSRFGVFRLFCVMESPPFAAEGPAAWNHCTPPSLQPCPLGYVRAPAMAGAHPDMRVKKKTLAQAASGRLQWQVPTRTGPGNKNLQRSPAPWPAVCRQQLQSASVLSQAQKFAAERHQQQFCHQRLWEGWSIPACTPTAFMDATPSFAAGRHQLQFCHQRL